MGKIESGEIGEVDPLPDSGNSLALIRYAKRAASSHSPQHAERGGSLRGGQRKPIGSSACPAPSSGHPKGISGDSVLFSALVCFPDVFAASVEAKPSGIRINRETGGSSEKLELFMIPGSD